jgi:hypothetical protein
VWQTTRVPRWTWAEGDDLRRSTSEIEQRFPDFESRASNAELVAERCHGCGRVELAFTKYPVGSQKLQELATVDLTGKSDHRVVINLKLPHRRLEADGNGFIVLFRLSGKPRVSGVGFSSS